MRRREFLGVLGGAAAAWPLATRAQAMPVIGFLHVGSAEPFAHLVTAFRQGLRETGYSEGRNVAIEFSWAEGHYDRLPGLAADLVRRRVALIVSGGGESAAFAAKSALGLSLPPDLLSIADEVIEMMRRREFITLLGGAAAAWPLAARAQQPGPMRRIGVLMAHSESDPEGHGEVTAFREGLQKLGWTKGRNIKIEYRWATPADAEARQRFAKELVAMQLDLILSHGTPTTATLLQQTRTIPVIFLNVSDPVGSGFAASFPRPGSNVTGFIPMEPTMAGKWLELLKETAPRVARSALLFNPETAPYAEYYLNPFKAAAESLAVEAIAAPVRDTSVLETVIAAQARKARGGLVVMPDTFTSAHRAEITALAARYSLPAVYPFRFFAELGGLLSYGNDRRDVFRRAASYADRILKGAKPSELPIQAPVKFELVINLKTAKALGLTVPPMLLARADEVIE